MSSDTISADPHLALKQSLRILIVLEYFPPHIGGVETLFEQLTRALVQAGHRVTVITLKVPGTKRHETLDGVEVVRIPAPRWARRAFFTFLAIPFAAYRAFRADIIHAATPSSAVSVWCAAWIARKPAVHTVHEVFADFLPMLPGLHPMKARAFRLYEMAMFRLPFAHYVCDSHFTRERLIRLMHIAAERTSVVYPVVDYAFWDHTHHEPRNLRAEFGLDEGSFLYLYFGRPGYLKGVEYLIDAAAQVRQHLPGSRLVLLLDHDPPNHYLRLRQRIADLGLQDHVILHDPVPREELPGYLLAANCVVVPSLSEGFGYAAIEAAALGCTIVTTTGHALQEILGGHAVFVPPRDGAALAEAIIAVTHDVSATPPTQQFTIETHIEEIEAIYERLVLPTRLAGQAGRERGYLRAR